MENVPGQILCLRQQIEFSARAEKAIGSSKGLEDLRNTIRNEIKKYTMEKSPDLQRVQQDKFRALILDAVHHADVVDNLIKDNCQKKEDWVWMKQLRFYGSNR